MSSKKNALPFDKRGGVVAMSRLMLNSEAYTALKPTAKVLMLLLHEQWRNERPVAYGLREAAAKIHCNKNTAGKCFDALQNAGFIECTDIHLFNSGAIGSKAREWRLTWLPYQGNKPTNEWEKWKP